MDNLTKSFCGLFVKDTNTSVPLTAVHYDVHVKAFASRITIHQTFKNEGPNDLECVYGFPINDQASILGFTVKIDNRTLTSQFKKKAEAFEEYSDAISRGDGAYLLDQSDRSDDTFVLSVGRLPPQKECIVAISYICTLDSITETKMRLVIPMSLSPRYNPTPKSSGGVIPPEKYQSTVPYSATLTGHIQTIDAISSVTSPTYPLAMTILGPKEVSVQFGANQQPLDRDLIVEIEVKSNPENHVEIEMTSAGKYSAMYALTPNFKLDSKIAVVNTELVFLVDCSGSMGEENKMEDAKRAMQVFLRSVPEGCYFNFYRFGSTFESLFLQSELYSSDSFTKAKNYASATSANLGGTEILAPLQKIFTDSPRLGFSRQLFVLTDGDVTNTEAVIELVRKNAHNTRVFSFGLGHSPSRSLVNGIAIAGNGKSEFIKQGEILEDKIGRHLNRALQPAVMNVSINWQGVKNLQQVPSTIPAVFKGDRQLVYAFFELDTDSHRSPGIVLQIGDSKFQVPLPDFTIHKVTDPGEFLISKLAARAWIKQLEYSPNQVPSKSSGSLQNRSRMDGAECNTLENDLEKKICAISLEYGILSKFVSLVAVEVRSDTDRAKVTSTMQLIEIPVQKIQNRIYPQHKTMGMTFAVCSSMPALESRNLRKLRSHAGIFSYSSSTSYQQKSFAVCSSSKGAKVIIADEDNVDTPKKLTNTSSVLTDLLDLQQWNGSWIFSGELESLTKISLEQIKATLVDQAVMDDHVLATALAVVYIKEKYPGQSNIWQAIVNKASVFLSNQTDAVVVSAIESTLLKLIKSQ